MQRATRAAWAVMAFSLLAGGPIAGSALANSPTPDADHALAVRTELLDVEGYRGLAHGEPVVVRGFPGVDGAPVDLELERFDVFAPGARIIVVDQHGEHEQADAGVVLLRGRMAGDADSRIFLGLSDNAVHGFIRSRGRTYSVSSGPSTGPGLRGGMLRIEDAASIPPALNGAPQACGFNADAVHLMANPADAVVDTPHGEDVSTNGQPCRIADIAVDSDWEFTQNLFNGQSRDAIAYGVILLAAVSEIYTDELNVRLRISYIRTFAADVDPYNGPNNYLGQLVNHWTSEQQSVTRDLTHMLSGRNDLPYGGVAYLSALCNSGLGYGLSGFLGGTFPYPLQSNSGGNWDLVVVAHELGHNFGTGHTHDSYNPPIDGCGNGDCSLAAQGTIMSYCHTCPGGITNIALTFGPQVRSRIFSYLNSACDITAAGSDAVPDSVPGVLQGVPTLIDPLFNDAAASCEPVALLTFDTVSLHGGTISLVPASAQWPRDRLLYTSTPGFVGNDRFNYEIVGGGSAQVLASVKALRAPDDAGPTEPGVRAAYFVVQGASVLPDFDSLVPYAEEVTGQVNFESTGGAFAGSGRSEEVGAVFEGLVMVSEPGLYTFFTSSDDGSRLFVGEELVVDNDGLHGMVERSGSIGLQAGAHRVRIEFWENFGGAGLIASLQGPGLAKQPITPGQWWHETPGVADLNGDGGVDFADLNTLLGAFGTNDGGDTDNDGDTDFEDLNRVLIEWGSAC